MTASGGMGEIGALASSIPALAPAPVERSSNEKRVSRSRTIVNFSELTDTYDARGGYPSLRSFQVTRFVPEFRPLGRLIPESDSSRAWMMRAYRREEKSSPRYLDARL